MNVVFDLGGVVVEWKPEAIVGRVFQDPHHRALALSQIIQHPDWLALDRGTLERHEAVARGAARTGLAELEIEALLDEVPRSLIAIPGTVALIHRLHERGHALYCLSNMHFASIEHLEERYDFFELFTGAVISCRLRAVKPEPEIYRHLLDRYDLDVAETIFIDDVDANVSAAARLGIRTITFENAEQCERELRALGCL